MIDLERELVPVLRTHALRVAGDDVPSPLVAAALEGGELLIEIHARLESEGVALPKVEEWIRAMESSTADVRPVPHTGCFCYHWIAVDLCDRSDEVAADLITGIAATYPGLPGLLVTSKSPEGLPDHVKVLTPESDPGLEEPTALLQYCRAILRGQPAARVFFENLEDVALLADSLDGHAVAIALRQPPLERGTDYPTSSYRREDFLQSLRWLASPRRGDLFDELELAWTRAWQRLASATVLLIEGSSTELREQLLKSGVEGGILARSAGAIASHLSPGRNLPIPIARDVRGRGGLEIRESDLTDRDPQELGRRVLFACLHLLGDALSATSVLRAHRALHPDDHVTFLVPDRAYARIFELSPDIDRVAYVPVDDDHQLVFEPSSSLVESLNYRPGEFDARHVLDIQEVARHAGSREGLHMAEGYARLLGIQLDSRLPSLDRELALRHVTDQAPDAPFIVFARHTVSGRHVSVHSKRTKLWHERKWTQLASKVRRELGLQVVSVGTSGESRLEVPGVLDLHDLSIFQLAGLLAKARALVTVDNGVFHLGLGLRTPLVHLQPRWLGATWTASAKEAAHRDLLANLPTLGVRRVFQALEELLLDTNPA